MSDAKPLPGGLADRLATSATGFGAVIGGVLNVRTVADTKKATALNAIYAMGQVLMSVCQDPECDCTVRVLAHYFPEVRIVPVTVEVADA